MPDAFRAVNAVFACRMEQFVRQNVCQLRHFMGRLDRCPIRLIAGGPEVALMTVFESSRAVSAADCIDNGNLFEELIVCARSACFIKHNSQDKPGCCVLLH